MKTTTYTVALTGSKNDILAMTNLMSEKLAMKKIAGKKQIKVAEVKGMLDDVQELAIEMAKVAGAGCFTMKGYYDQSQLDGHYVDFEITYANGKLISCNSDYYTELSAGELYADYEEFCDEYQDDDGEPLFTEEQYEEFCEGEYFEVGYDKSNVVAEVPMIEQYELTIA